MIIAMAGHVDHGKTSLIRALTGIDPDRLPDERRRGMTIDLGFAHARLAPDTPLIGFVDVPGHERFLGNMLAGVMGVDSALLVIAADDGPMPQTAEHLAILRLIGVTDLSVAMSKIDRVEPARVEAARAEITDSLTNAGYDQAPVIPLSSHTGEGLDALRAHLAAKAATWRPRAAAGRFRLSVDRAFVVDGTGLVVTGTVVSGAASVGDRLMLSPQRLAARVRGLQRHHEATDRVQAGDRCALAIAGPQIERGRIRRGDWLIDPASHAPTQRLDVTIQAVAGHPLRHGGRAHIHLGATAVSGRAVTFGGRDLAAGESDLVSLTLDRPVAALWDDRIVLRDEGSGRVVGGGRVIDPFPPARRVRREARVPILTALADPDPAQAMAALLAADGWVDVGALALARNLAVDTLTDAATTLPARLIGSAARPVLLAEATEDTIAARVTDRLGVWHRDHPDLPGPAQATLLSGLAMLPPEVTEAVLRGLIARGAVVSRARALALPGHQPRLAPADETAWAEIEPTLHAPDLRPPRVRELAVTLGLDPVAAEALLLRLERFGLVLRVAPNRFFLPETVGALGVIAETMAREAEAEGADGFNAAAFSQRSGIGRNLTIQVLEYLDRAGLTRRNGEFRHLARPVSEVFG